MIDVDVVGIDHGGDRDGSKVGEAVPKIEEAESKVTADENDASFRFIGNLTLLKGS